tara:strand:+ start:1364 stop:1552 length:189 start_codon:yes stop_codon:yes gene_type:complete
MELNTTTLKIVIGLLMLRYLIYPLIRYMKDKYDNIFNRFGKSGNPGNEYGLFKWKRYIKRRK